MIKAIAEMHVVSLTLPNRKEIIEYLRFYRPIDNEVNNF